MEIKTKTKSIIKNAQTSISPKTGSVVSKSSGSLLKRAIIWPTEKKEFENRNRRPGENRSNRPHILRLNREKPELFNRNRPLNSRFGCGKNGALQSDPPGNMPVEPGKPGSGKTRRFSTGSARKIPS